jgi:hypothetical protein
VVLVVPVGNLIEACGGSTSGIISASAFTWKSCICGTIAGTICVASGGLSLGVRGGVLRL